jgi:thermitase
MKHLLSIVTLLITVAFTVNAQDESFAPDEILVKIKEITPYKFEKNKTNLGIASVDQINENLGVVSIQKLIKSQPTKNMSNRPNTDKLLIIKFNQNIDVEELVREYMQTEVFEFAEPNYIGKGGGVQGFSPNDPNYSNQWQFYNNGTFNSDAVVGADIKMEDAWDITTGDSSIVVAILDSGMKLDHPEISSRIWQNTADNNGDGLDDDNNGYNDDFQGWDFAYSDNIPDDPHGHGTNVGSIVGMDSNNGTGLAGVDWNCKLMIGRILDENNSGYYSWWADAIFYAVDNGADVINISAGGSSFSFALKTAIDYAHTNNVVVVVSMMNEDNNTTYYPAGFANSIAIGATGVDDKRVSPFFWNATSGSSFGNHIDLAAPGSPIYGLSNNSNTNYSSYWGGTSQAAPQVAGVVSLMKALDPALGVEAIRDILKNTADDQVGDPSEDIAGWDQYYGAGRMNAGAALAFVLSAISSNEEVNSTFKFSISPNPASEFIRIDTDNQTIDQLSIYSMDGKLIRQLTNLNKNENINIQDLSSGIYLIEIQIGEQHMSQKLIIKEL